MTPSQAALYLRYRPGSAWSLHGVSGGLLGSILFCCGAALRGRYCRVVHRLRFALLRRHLLRGLCRDPAQLAILAVVVLIAAALLWASWLARKRGLLR